MHDDIRRQRSNALRDFRRTAQEDVFSRHDDKELDRILRSSDYARLVRSMMRAVEEQAHETTKDPRDVYQDFEVAAEVVANLRDALSPLRYSVDDINAEEAREHYNFWRHVSNPEYKVMAGKTPRIHREGVEAAVSAYLDCPVRIEEMDRLFIDALIGTELFAIANQMYKTGIETDLGYVTKPSRKFSLVGLWFRMLTNQLRAFVFWIVAVIVALYLGWINNGWALGLTTVVVLLFVLGSVLTLILRSKAARAVNDSQSELRSFLDRIVRIYSHLDTVGPISIPRLRKEIDDAADNDIAWPRSIFVLLDDIAKRTDRLA